MSETPPASQIDITRESRLERLEPLAVIFGIPLLGLGALARVGGDAGETAIILLALSLGLSPVLAALALASAPVAAYLARARLHGIRLLESDERGIYVVHRNEKRWHVPWSEVGVAWAREHHMVELATAGGDEARVIFDTPDGAASFVALVRRRADSRRAYPLALESDSMRLLRKASAWLVPSAIAAGALAIGPWGWAALPISIALSWLGARGSPRLVLGADGVLIRGRFRQRYVPYREIAAVESGGSIFGARTLSLRLVNGKRVSLGWLLGARRAALARALVEEGMRMAERGAEAGAELSTLARGDHEDEASWMARVLAAARRGGYRGPALDAETLLSLMRNPAADPEQRVAAALALRSSEEGVARIRVAASVSTEPEVKEALDALAEDDVDDERIARALKRLSTRR